MKHSVRQTARILRVIGERYSREETLAMSREVFNALIASIGEELYPASKR